MRITEELIEWCKENDACEEGIEYACEHIGDDVHTMPSDYRQWVMIHRKDCPIDLEGLDSDDKAFVMINRKDCPIDLEGLISDDKELVIVTGGIEQ